jgi:hypothetical protein
MSLNAALDRRLSVPFAIKLFWGTLAAVLLFSLFGPRQAADSNAFHLLAKIVLNVNVALWVYADGRARGFAPDSFRFNLFVTGSALLTEIVVPVYLVKSRGWKGAAISSWRFLKTLAGLIVVMFTAGLILRLLGLH